MDVFTSLGILVVLVLIQAFLQLKPGLFALFYHYALGKKSRRAAADLSVFFIAGSEVMIAVIFLFIYFLTYSLCYNLLNLDSSIFTWIMVGILFALAALTFFVYFRKDGSLFLPRQYAKSLDAHAKSVKSRSDAFLLGALSNVPELIFTLPLYFLAALEIMKFDSFPLVRGFLALVCILLISLPLFSIRALFQTHHNLADIERPRKKNRNFYRLSLTLGYLILAVGLIAFRILN